MKRTALSRTKPLRRISKKQQGRYYDYLKLRAEFLAQNRQCEAGPIILVHTKQNICTSRATTVHHSHKRGKRLNDMKHWVPCCLPCHRYIEDHKTWAREVGLLAHIAAL